MEVEEAAQIHELKEWEARNTPRPAMPTYAPGHPKYGPEFCDECDEPMPDLRRAMGSRLCTACASAVERRNRR